MKTPFSEQKAWVFYQERLRKNSWTKDELCDPPTSDKEGMQYLIDNLLGPDWCVTMPESREQINTVAIFDIIYKYVDQKPNLVVRAISWFLVGFGIAALLFN